MRKKADEENEDTTHKNIEEEDGAQEKNEETHEKTTEEDAYSEWTLTFITELQKFI